MTFSLTDLPLPVRLRTEKPLSEEDLLRFCAGNESLRIEREVSGELIVMTPTGNQTGKINLRLGRLLDQWAEEDGGGVAFDSSTGFRLPSGEVRSPDAAWVSKRHWEALTDEEQRGFGPLCPEFVIELASPSDRLPDVKKKMEQVWLKNGAELAWLIDVETRTVTIYRRGEEPETLFDPSSVQGEGQVRGFELVLGRLWS